MNALVKQEQPQQADPMFKIIATAASDPNVDITKMQALLDMRERLQNKEAERSFYSAFAEMQGKLPTITKTGEIRDKAGRIQSRYAKWENINEAIKPILQEHGFTLMFQTADVETVDKIKVRGTLAHRGGHKESSEKTFPIDLGPGRSAVQSNGSSISYGKRYMANALLNITVMGEDDDGQGGDGDGRANEESTNMPALREAAEGGWASLQKAWGALSAADRNTIGIEFAALKKRAEAIDAEKKGAK